MSEPEYCVSCGARALRDLDGGLAGWAATIAMDPDCDHKFVSERTLTVPGWLARYQVRQHLKLNGIDFTEDKRDRDSVFTVSVTDLQWEAINRAVEQAGI